MAFPDAVELTRQLIRIPSENPPGREREIASYVADLLRPLPSVTVDVTDVEPDRPNVTARLAGSEPSLSPVVLLAHMDTVPAGEGWTRDPFDPGIVDGRLYGRGSTDMKSGLAAAMVAFAAAAERGTPPRRSVILCATADEEGAGMLGAQSLISQGVVDRDSLIVCTEPSDLALVVAHKGVIWYEVEVFGRSAHAGNPHVGIDSIYVLASVIQELREKIEALAPSHPLLGPPTVTFSLVSGGIKTNVVPPYARMDIDVRIPPPATIEQLASAIQDVIGRVAARFPGSRIEARQTNIDRPPVESDTASELARGLADAFRRVTGRDVEYAGFPAYTDASIIAARTGNPRTIVFGPGRLTDAHTADESIEVDQITVCADVLTEAINGLCFG